MEGDEQFSLSSWDQRSPLHFNVCFEEPQSQPLTPSNVAYSLTQTYFRKPIIGDPKVLDRFLENVARPLVIVNALKLEDRTNVKNFLLELQAPVFLESPSGLREDPELQSLVVHFPDKLYPRASECGYPIDGVLRIGGVPTLRFWRDLEIIRTIPVLSINDVPFSALTESETPHH